MILLTTGVAIGFITGFLFGVLRMEQTLRGK